MILSPLVGALLADRVNACLPSSRQPPVTYFVLTVRMGASSYQVHRRFKDFDMLYEGLCRAHGKQNVPSLPPKQVIKNESHEFLQKRWQLLTEFIAALLDDKVLSMTPELCAFLECESGAQLTKANADLSSCTGMLIREVSDAERLASSTAAELAHARSEVADLRKALIAMEGARATEQEARTAAEFERDAALVAAKAGRERVLAMVCRGRDQRLAANAFHSWVGGTEPKVKNAPDVGAALTAALSAALNLNANGPTRASEPTAVAPLETAPVLSDQATSLAEAEPAVWIEEVIAEHSWHAGPDEAEDKQLAPDVPRKHQALDSPPAAPPPPSEHAIKSGLLLKQGAGNKKYQERYFELVSLGVAGEYGAFLVYYESELKASVKGYISLEGASVSACEHASEPFAFTLTTPARRLTSKGDQMGADCPPSLDARMSLIEKLDNWGKHALRNILAEGPKHAPFTTWSLAAPSSTERQAWFDGFAHVLDGAKLSASLASPGYGEHGSGRVARTHVSPVQMSAEEVM